MADEGKKIIVDDDWKAEAQREKDRLAEETIKPEELPEAQFAELINLLAMQALVGLGMVSGQGGERIPPNLEIAKHYVDLLQLLEDKTRNNLTDDEKKIMDMALYEMRTRYIQAVSGGSAMGPAPAPPSA